MKRHPSHNYASAGGYFITFSTSKRRKILGRVDGSKVVLSDQGVIVRDVLGRMPSYYPNLTTDAFQIMPDHVHCVLILNDPKVLGVEQEKCKGISQIVQAFKAVSAREINKLQNTTGSSVWQKGYHERVIRGEGDLEKFRYYTETNPLRESLKTRD